jgi:hypothetical protein
MEFENYQNIINLLDNELKMKKDLLKQERLDIETLNNDIEIVNQDVHLN